MDLPCPNCRHDPIGNNRARCKLCNRYTSRLRAAINKALRVSDPLLVAELKRRMKRPVYDQLATDYRRETDQ